MRACTTLVAASLLGLASAFVPPAPLTGNCRASATRAYAAVAPASNAAAAKVEGVHDGIVKKLVDGLKVEATDYPASLDMASFSKAGVKGEVAGYKGNVRLVWSGESKVASEDGAKFQSDLAIWVGPLTQVPHLLVSMGVEGQSLKLFLDYVPRDDVAYVTGNNHLEDFYKGPAREAAEAAATDPLVTSRNVVDSFYSRVLQSPASISVTLPATDEGAAKAAAWADAHVERWLGWMASAKELDRMKRGFMLSRDNGVRRTWVEGQALLLNNFMGGADPQMAKQLAIAQSGPQQEAYVGGYS